MRGSFLKTTGKEIVVKPQREWERKGICGDDCERKLGWDEWDICFAT
jgi:hypothetical protein